MEGWYGILDKKKSKDGSVICKGKLVPWMEIMWLHSLTRCFLLVRIHAYISIVQVILKTCVLYIVFCKSVKNYWHISMILDISNDDVAWVWNEKRANTHLQFPNSNVIPVFEFVSWNNSVTKLHLQIQIKWLIFPLVEFHWEQSERLMCAW